MDHALEAFAEIEWSWDLYFVAEDVWGHREGIWG